MSHPATGNDRVTPQPWTRPTIGLLAVVILVGVILGWLSRGAVTPIYGDASIYVSLAQSMGEGHFRDDYLIGSPPHAQYPPGMPGWILLIRLIFGRGLDPALMGNILLVALCACMVADAVRRLASPSLGVVAAALIVFNPPLVALTAQLRSEILFLFLCTAALWLSLVQDGRQRRWYPALIIAAALAAFLTRSAGVALIPAIAWAFLIRRQWKPLGATIALSAVVVLGWFAYTRWASPQTVARTYAVDLASATPVNQPIRLVAHAISNGRTFFAQLSSVQFGIPDMPAQPLDNLLFGLLILIPAGMGMFMLRKRWPAMVMFTILSGVMMLVFPWPLTRLLTVMVPWLAITMLVGWSGLMTRFFPAHSQRITLAVGVLLAAIGAVKRLEAARSISGCRTSPPYTDPRCYRKEDRAYAQAAAFIRDSLPDDGGVGASKPASIYLLTGRQTLPLELFDRTSASKLMKPAGPLSVVLLARLLPFEYEYIAPRLLTECRTLTLRREYAKGTLVLQRRMEGDPDACAALTQYNSASATYSDDEPE